MTNATNTAPSTPAIYRPNSTSPRNENQPIDRSLMKALMISAYTGSRAEQVISGASKMVAIRSRTFGMVRVAIMPGIAQAYEDSSGMNERPESPMLPMRRSSRNAARGR